MFARQWPVYTVSRFRHTGPNLMVRASSLPQTLTTGREPTTIGARSADFTRPALQSRLYLDIPVSSISSSSATTAASTPHGGLKDKSGPDSTIIGARSEG